MEESIRELVENSKSVLIIQADNPDGDSLASSLALEGILSTLGKTVYMYCGVAMPSYLRYMEGWDRVSDQLPANFDMSIIVDTSALVLLEQLQKTGDIKWLRSKPLIIIDHHDTEPTIDFAMINYIKPAVAAAEVIFEIVEKLKWPRDIQVSSNLTIGILSDSLGLTSEGTTARSIEIISKLVADGVSIPELENKRRLLQKKSPELVQYKADLLKRIEYASEGRIAYITIPWDEIEKYSHQYNPSMLVLDEMRQVTDVQVAIAFKTYPDGRITAKIRANHGYLVAGELAAHFGGGGHAYAAGFKIMDKRSAEDVITECISFTTQLLDKLKVQDKDDQTPQYTYTIN